MGERTMIGASSNHLEMLLEMAAAIPSASFSLMYVLLRPGDPRDGRYKSPDFSSLSEVRTLFERFAGYFTGDGNHQLWLLSAVEGAFLIYDQHDVITAYGECDDYESLLTARGFRSGKFYLPRRPIYFSPENAGAEAKRLVECFDWERSDLQKYDRMAPPWMIES